MSEPELPRSTATLFTAFNRLALQGFGGVLAVAQVELVERRRWLTREQFVELLSISQVLPGPNIVNLSLMFGDRCLGWRGAAAALGGLMLVPLCIVLALTLVYTRFADHPAVAGALRGMGSVAAGLVMATALKLAGSLKANRLGPALCTAIGAATFAAVALARVPLVWVILGIGSIGCALAAWRHSR
ncbi:MAG: chromate transporter [Piscinibacter sp.]|nr:chromate transporter [Piscinibacter sp.]